VGKGIFIVGWVLGFDVNVSLLGCTPLGVHRSVENVSRTINPHPVRGASVVENVKYIHANPYSRGIRRSK
jgi:hypothetical protein